MGNAASSLPFSIGKQVAFVNNGWALHQGNRKSNNEAVSVFTAKKPALQKTPMNPRQPNLTQFECALHHFQNCKKLRHPHILQVYATLDTDNPNETTTGGGGSSHQGIGNPQNTAASSSSNTGDLIIVTEPCVSLDTWLNCSNPPPEQVAWGLESIVRGLHFLHTSAGLCHGNLSPESFYVTPAGDVKIWNFSITISLAGGNVPRHFIDWEGLVTPQPYRAPERIEGRWDAIAVAGVHCMDSYGLGILISHLFGGQVPQKLVKAVQRLQTTNIKMRPRLQPLLKCPIFDTPYQKLQLQLEEFAVQPVEQKIAFWSNLTPNLQAELIPEQLAVYKLLPLMKTAIETICTNESMRAEEAFRKEVLSMLNPLFYIAENFLDSSTVGAQLGSVVGILFKVNDRAIRGTLLQKAPFMAENFDQNTLNEAVFEPMCSGFSDSSAALRELTLKATAVLVPHLTHPNLEKLARYLVRLQSDQEASIRTNTVIFFSKLAPYLTETTRQKMLLPAFVRAMKDPFTPCRLAALKSTLKAKEHFDPMGIASRVMPAITPQLLDSSADVRREAFAAVDDLLFVLRQESERLNSLPEPTVPNVVAPAPTSANAPQTRPVRKAAASQEAPKSAGFSISGISSWMTSKATAPDSAKPAVAQAPKAVPSTAQQRHAPVSPRPVAHPVPSTTMNNMSLNDSEDWGDTGQGWDEDDLLDLSSTGMKVGRAAPAPAQSASLFAPARESEDDFFGGFDAKPAKPATMRKMGGGGKLSVPSKKSPKPAVQKLATDDVSDGWDDF